MRPRPGVLLILCFILICSIGIQARRMSSVQMKTKASILGKKEAIRLFPNPSYDGTITISTSLADTLHFYIFDLESTLINQTVLTKKEKKTITNLTKGTYMYDVFAKDESIEEGKIIIK